MFLNKTNSFEFKKEFSFQHRLEESSRVILKYPDRIPIICEKLPNQKNLPNIDKKKYLVPCELTISQFMYVIRKRINLKSEEALFLFINNQMISGTAILGQIYNLYKDVDGFLYVQYAKENVFG